MAELEKKELVENVQKTLSTLEYPISVMHGISITEYHFTLFQLALCME